MKKILLIVLLFKTLLVFADPPNAEEVFQFNTKKIDPNTFSLQWVIKPGYFLYKDKIQLNENESNFEIGRIAFPEAFAKPDKQGRNTFVYKENLSVPVSILGKEPGEGLVTIKYQGCSQDGFCYPPQIKKVKLGIDGQLALAQVNVEEDLHQFIEAKEEALETVFSSHNVWWLIGSFFGFGLLLSLTPCILPMVPVLSGIIVGHGHTISTRKAFFLSLSYVLSMAVTYAVVGGLIATIGSNLQILMQSPISISIFSALFILLALSMFNFYELKLPVSWQSKLAGVTRSHEGGHYLSAALMGSLSTLILSPCVTAPLIGALGYIAQTGNVFEGSLALFFLGLGMGSPLLIIGASAGKLLPKAGHWMNSVKSFFGVLLIGVAIYMLDRILPAFLTMALWGCLCVFSGIYMGALLKAESNAGKLRQGLGIIFLLYGLLIIIGASKGNTNPFQPLVTPTNLASSTEIDKVVRTLPEAQQAIQLASGQPILLDFYADWCTSCKLIKATTLKDIEVKNQLKNFAVITVDLSANNEASKELLNYFKVVAPPTFLFLNDKGQEVRKLRLVGEIDKNTLLAKSKHLM